MIFILLAGILFTVFYYSFQWYLKKEKILVDGMEGKLAIIFFKSGIVGIVILFISLPFFLLPAGNGKGGVLLELLSFIVWGGGFIIPFILLAKEKCRIPWFFSLGVTLITVTIFTAITYIF